MGEKYGTPLTVLGLPDQILRSLGNLWITIVESFAAIALKPNATEQLASYLGVSTTQVQDWLKDALTYLPTEAANSVLVTKPGRGVLSYPNFSQDEMSRGIENQFASSSTPPLLT